MGGFRKGRDIPFKYVLFQIGSVGRSVIFDPLIYHKKTCIFQALRFLTLQKWLFWGPRPLLYRFKPFHWRVQGFLGRKIYNRPIDPIWYDVHMWTPPAKKTRRVENQCFAKDPHLLQQCSMLSGQRYNARHDLRSFSLQQPRSTQGNMVYLPTRLAGA